MPDTQTLAQMVRSKYPGVYDDISDADLDAKVRSKYPGVYDDLPKSSAPVKSPHPEAQIGPAMRGTAIPFPAQEDQGPTYDDLIRDPKGTILTLGRMLGKEASDPKNWLTIAAMYFGPKAIGYAMPKISAAMANVEVPSIRNADPDLVGLASPRAAHVLRVAQRVAGKGGAPEAPVAAPTASSADVSTIAAAARAARAERFGSGGAPVNAAGQVIEPTVTDPQVLPPGRSIANPKGQPVPTAAQAPEASARAEIASAANPRGQTASAAPAAASVESVSTTPSLTTLKPETVKGLLTRWADRASVSLTPDELESGVRMVQQGAKPSEVVDAIAQGRPQSSGGIPTAPAERMVYDRLRRTGASHQEALQHVQQARALQQALGTPSVEEMVTRTERRNATGRWTED